MIYKRNIEFWQSSKSGRINRNINNDNVPGMHKHFFALNGNGSPKTLFAQLISPATRLRFVQVSWFPYFTDPIQWHISPSFAQT